MITDQTIIRASKIAAQVGMVVENHPKVARASFGRFYGQCFLTPETPLPEHMQAVAIIKCFNQWASHNYD